MAKWEGLLDAVVVSNTVPYAYRGYGACFFGKKTLPARVRSRDGSAKSPLAHLGGGGLSGSFMVPLVSQWLYELRRVLQSGLKVIAGGGIQCPEDVTKLRWYGASAVFVGSAAILRPWRVRSIVRCANSLRFAGLCRRFETTDGPYYQDFSRSTI